MSPEKGASLPASPRKSRLPDVDGRFARCRVRRHWTTVTKIFRKTYSGSFGQSGNIPLPTLIPTSRRILRHNSVHAGCETLADQQATQCVDEAHSSNCIVDHISNHGGPPRSARFSTSCWRTKSIFRARFGRRELPPSWCRSPRSPTWRAHEQTIAYSG